MTGITVTKDTHGKIKQMSIDRIYFQEYIVLYTTVKQSVRYIIQDL